jgi:hypothetical protein
VIQLTHFSDLIGASHSPAYTEYAVGGYASDGFKELAEWGNTQKMEMEMKEHVNVSIFNSWRLYFKSISGKRNPYDCESSWTMVSGRIGHDESQFPD